MSAPSGGFVERAVLERTALHVARFELANAVVELEPLAQVLSHRMVAPAREAILRARAALACLDQDGCVMADDITGSVGGWRVMAERRGSSLGPTETFLLRCWGNDLCSAFGAMPYLVGSVVRGEAWRDVDVRMMLDPADPLLVDRVRLTVLSHAVTMWGQRATGLPIDFQFQHRDEANAEFDGRRNALGLRATLPWNRTPAVGGVETPGEPT